MLKASDARKISQTSKNKTVQEMRERIESLILQRAQKGYYWASYDYNYILITEAVSYDDIAAMIYDLRDAGYDVKDNWLAHSLDIRW